jgi:hypothetical protein
VICSPRSRAIFTAAMTSCASSACMMAAGKRSGVFARHAEARRAASYGAAPRHSNRSLIAGLTQIIPAVESFLQAKCATQLAATGARAIAACAILAGNEIQRLLRQPGSGARRQRGGIKKAYRRLARKYHPDVSKEADAEEKFKEVAEAYQTLKDPEKRAAYDQLGSSSRRAGIPAAAQLAAAVQRGAVLGGGSRSIGSVRASARRSRQPRRAHGDARARLTRSPWPSRSRRPSTARRSIWI